LIHYVFQVLSRRMFGRRHAALRERCEADGMYAPLPGPQSRVDQSFAGAAHRPDEQNVTAAAEECIGQVGRSGKFVEDCQAARPVDQLVPQEMSVVQQVQHIAAFYGFSGLPGHAAYGVRLRLLNVGDEVVYRLEVGLKHVCISLLTYGLRNVV